MEKLLIEAIEISVLIIYVVAAMVIIFGTGKAIVGIVKSFLEGEDRLREIGVELGRWLIAGLTFMLAADILETMIETEWEGISRLAAIAAIRTFLNFFLERDMREMRETEAKAETS